jgi:hypothetical protein
MTTLAALVTLLQQEVPAVDGVPTSEQYNQAVKDAVMEFSRRCGLTKISTLSIVSGTATYSLPADFLRMISLDALVGVDGVIVGQNGLIPLSKDFEEEFIINPGTKQITFYPTPAYSMTRYFKYKGGWVATGADYTTIGEDEARIVILKAKAIAFGKQSNAAAGSSLKYSFGAVSEDLDGGSESSANSASDAEKEFLAACETYNGQHAVYG